MKSFLETLMVQKLWQMLSLSHSQKKTRHVFVKHGCPRQQQSPNMAKSLSPTF